MGICGINDDIASLGIGCDDSHNDVVVEAGTNIASAITVIICRVEVMQKHKAL